MKVELLREIYNNRYSINPKAYTCNNIKQSNRLINNLLNYLKGFENANKSVLDVGCGFGYYTESFRRHGIKAYGFDISEVAINYAKNTFPKCEYFVMDDNNPTIENTYDIVFIKGFSITDWNDDDLVKLINKYTFMLSQGGFLIFSWAYDNNWTPLRIKKVVELIGMEYSFNYLDKLHHIKRMLGKKNTFYLFLKPKEEKP